MLVISLHPSTCMLFFLFKPIINIGSWSQYAYVKIWSMQKVWRAWKRRKSCQGAVKTLILCCSCVTLSFFPSHPTPTSLSPFPSDSVCWVSGCLVGDSWLGCDSTCRSGTQSGLPASIGNSWTSQAPNLQLLWLNLSKWIWNTIEDTDRQSCGSFFPPVYFFFFWCLFFFISGYLIYVSLIIDP